MRKVSFSELVNIDSLKKMAENIYAAAGIPIGIIDVEGTIRLQLAGRIYVLSFIEYIQLHASDVPLVINILMTILWMVDISLINV